MTHENTMDQLDILLMRVLDGEASPAEREELLALADSDARLAELGSLRERLRDALEQNRGEVDVVADVLAVLGLEDDWAPMADALREELDTDGLELDLADAVLAQIQPVQTEEERLALRLSALHDGELKPAERLELADFLSTHPNEMKQLTAHADLGREIREALHHHTRREDLSGMWAAVAGELGVADPEEVPGWEPIADLLRQAVAEHATLEASEDVALTAAVMNALPRPVAPEPDVDTEEVEDEAHQAVPFWRQIFSNPVPVMVAMAAALLLSFLLNQPNPADIGPSADQTVAAVQAEEDPIQLASVNEVVVEDLEYGSDVWVSQMELGDELEEDVLTIIFIDEGDGA